MTAHRQISSFRLDIANDLCAGAATAIAGGTSHSLAVVGGVVCAWGLNGNGQLGDNSATQRTRSGSDQYTHRNHRRLRREHSQPGVERTTTRSGRGEATSSAQLGDTTTTDQHVPVQSAGIANAIEIAAGSNFSVARLSSPVDSLLTWGGEGAGQLGDGISNIRPVPIQISGLSGVTQASAGNGHTLALLTGGTVMGLGNNGNGQLGDNSHDARDLTPVRGQRAHEYYGDLGR